MLTITQNSFLKGSSDPTKSTTIEHSLTSLCHLRSLAEQFIVVTSILQDFNTLTSCLKCSLLCSCQMVMVKDFGDG